ncbi:helix-turn-helix transcriptional regulator [Desulfovibrio sp. OttesenSCG-928-M16]|nr:helix-turn-helix transcriptional regulator [Desulfovibrio sp. OttesenSCG-928-M16]
MFVSNIPRLMKEKKKTARALIAATDLSPNTLTKLRKDEGIAECRLSTLGRIAQALAVPVKDLFDEEHEEPRHDK